MKKIKRIANNKAQIITPYMLSDDKMKDIIAKFPKLQTMPVENKVDPSLIAGFIIKQESNIYDASISGKINYLLNKIYENN